MAKQDKDSRNVAGMAFVGCAVLGVGIGMLTEQTGVFTVIGAGTGFIVMAVIMAVTKKK